MIRGDGFGRNEAAAAGAPPSYPPSSRPSYTSSVKGAPITVRCDCGEKALVAYGVVWVCESCQRRWNTNQIPSEDYWAIMHEMRRFRMRAIYSMLVLAAVFVVLAVVISASFFILIPLVMSAWYLFYMPRWRQQVRRHARHLPNWELHPE
jgi:hypothetical protein